MKRVQIALLMSATLTFLLIMGQYWLVSSNPLSSRVGFAFFMTVAPLVAAEALVLITKLKSVLVMVVFYFGVFILGNAFMYFAK